MSAINLRLPDSLHDMVRHLSQEDQISINQFIVVAVAEKISALTTESYLKMRGDRASREKFDAVRAKISSVPPREDDQLP